MTETGQESVVEEEKSQLPAGLGEDYLLQDIVELANLGVGLGVTLNCGGCLISGVVISGKLYFERLIEQIDGAVAADVLKEGIKSRFSDFLPIYENAHDPTIERPLPAFIHLQNATFHGPGGGSITEQGVLWRGRISQVDGFSVGNYGSK